MRPETQSPQQKAEISRGLDRLGDNGAAEEPSPQEINTLVALFKQERYAEMETLARAMTVRFPNNGIGWKAVGTALLQQGRNEEALGFLQKAAGLSHGDAQPHNNIGNILVKLGRLPEAAASYRQALELNPDFVEVHHNLGNVFLKLGRLFEAEASYRQALKLKPEFAEAHNNLGNVLRELNRPSEAEASFRQALKLRPDYVEAHNNLGSALNEQSRFSEAEASYRRALEINPKCSDALFGLGYMYLGNGEIEKAENSFTQAFEAEPNDLLVRIHLAHVKKTKEGDSNFVALVDIANAARDSETPLAIPLHFALGKCYDDIGDYEKAFLHFLKGCKLKRATLNYDMDQVTRGFAGIMRILDRPTIDRLRGAGDPSCLPVFVLGMPRSGTTLIEQIIASHPDVHGAGELFDLMGIARRNDISMATQPAFPDNLCSLDQPTLTAWGAEYVAGLQQRAPGARRITDKMPANFLVVGLIHLMLPGAKIIHVNRNPVDTCLSCFTHMFDGNGQEYTYDLAELGRYYVNYFRLMEHWRKVLPDGAFLDVRYEDVVADQEAQARRIIEYCGLEWDDTCLDFHKNKRLVRTASVMQVRQPMYKSSVERWRHYEKFLGPLLDALGDLSPER